MYLDCQRKLSEHNFSLDLSEVCEVYPNLWNCEFALIYDYYRGGKYNVSIVSKPSFAIIELTNEDWKDMVEYYYKFCDESFLISKRAQNTDDIDATYHIGMSKEEIKEMTLNIQREARVRRLEDLHQQINNLQKEYNKLSEEWNIKLTLDNT